MTTQNYNLFQCDNENIHKEKKIVKFLKYINVDVIKWPGNSPDIAPIENIFEWVNKHLEGRDVRTISKLKREVRKTFKILKQSFLKNLVKSLPKRLQLVTKSNGEMFKY